MRRTVFTILLATLAVVLPVQGASAGGNWLDFRGEDPVDGKRNLGTWAVMHVGQEVVAHTGVYAMNPDRRERLENEGPFYAWLSPGDSYLEGTNLPADAVRLAPFAVRFDGSNGVPVSARFTVPAVPSGEYEVMVCNDPCTYSGFGEFIQGWVTIMQTPEESRLFALNRDRKWEIRELSRKIGRLEGAVGAAEGEVAAASAAVRAAALGLRSSDRVIELLESETEALRARLAAAERGVRVPMWAIVAIVVALVGSLLLIGRRRSPAFEIPDTVPDELIERDRTGV